MLPLTLAKEGEQNLIKKVGGKSDARLFLENLGFVPGSFVTVITKINGNVIVSIKESRVAISRDMASTVMV